MLLQLCGRDPFVPQAGPQVGLESVEVLRNGGEVCRRARYVWPRRTFKAASLGAPVAKHVCDQASLLAKAWLA